MVYQKDRQPWHAIPLEMVSSLLNVDTSRGLTGEEVEKRRRIYGRNSIEVGTTSPWYRIFLRQFFDVLILILAVAGVISLLLGETADAIAIFAIILLNGVLGFTQEWKAEKAVQALRQMLTPKCRVRREGAEHVIKSEDLVPGDVVFLATGAQVPADIRLLSLVNLKVDESILTGESVSVDKELKVFPIQTSTSERTNMLFMGTSVTNGRAKGVVVATGQNTEFGRIATLTQTVQRETTPLQRQLAALASYLGILALVVVAFIVLMGWHLGKPLLEMFMTGVSLAVAIVPEGLPAVVTVTLALGLHAMIKRRALIRRLQAAETLGAATVICTDKTGTLTQNEMTVQKIWLYGKEISVTGVGYDPEGDFHADGGTIDPQALPALEALLTCAMHCNNADLEKTSNGWQRCGEPTEAALLSLALKGKFTKPSGQVVREITFNSTRKRMSVIVEAGEGDYRICTKGAPEVLLSRANKIRGLDYDEPLTPERRDEVINAYQAMAAKGLRTLCLAQREIATLALTDDEVEQDLTILGIVGITDPPRPEVFDAIKLAQAAGIRVIMMTGDSEITAQAIAEQIGLRIAKSVTGSDVENLSDNELETLLKSPVLFARTAPDHKMRIVSALQATNEVVAMTGDGVNDAPALRKADIGIAMGIRGTDVARSASDIVLMDDNFASIIAAVEEGRRQYDNIKKFVHYLLTSNAGEMVAVVISIIVGGPLIFLPVQILWINLVTDGLTAVALGLEPAEGDSMRQPPRTRHEKIVSRSGLLTITLIGLYLGIAAFYLFTTRHDTGDIVTAQTLAFCFLVVCENMNVLNFRSLRQPIYALKFFSNPWLLLAIAGTLFLQWLAVSVPFLQKGLHTTSISLADWGMLVVFSLPVLVLPEVTKAVAVRLRR